MPRIFSFARLLSFARARRGGGLGVTQARAAELRGDLAHAAVLFAQAGRLDEAARVMVLRGDAEIEPAVRLRHYLQAVATAPPGSVAHVHATRKRAATVLAIAAGAPLSPALLQDVMEAARALEGIGDHGAAAEAYARAGDVEGQVRALAKAGDLERLDALLAEEQGRNRERIARMSAHGEVAALTASGSRRAALAIAVGSAGSDPALREKGQALERRRVTGSVAHLVLRGRRLGVALGDTVVLGRQPERERAATAGVDPQAGEPRTSEGTIPIASSAVSRRHLAVMRRGDLIVVRDLGSRNGTALRGLALTGEVPVGDGVELRLGGEVPVVVSPSSELPGAVRIDAAGTTWIAPLGPARLGIGRWRLERGDDDWVELVTDGDPAAFAGAMLLSTRVTLLEGDAIATTRGGPVVLAVRGGREGEQAESPRAGEHT